MKYLFVICALALGLWTGICCAEEGVNKAAAAGTVVAGDDADRGMEEIDTDYDDDETVREEYGVDTDTVMPSGQVYDENTGMPDVVPSDREFELE